MFDLYVTHESREKSTTVYNNQDTDDIMALVGTHLSYQLEEGSDRFVSFQIIRKKESDG